MNIVIIGRPNTGKSTLFNRLIGRRRAITDPTAGVTRDLVTEPWILAGNKVFLTDSGGVKLEKTGIDRLVSEKSLSLPDKADAIIFLMDCKEVTPEDEMLIKTLRPYSDKVLLAVNKIDDPSREELVWNFFQYGYQRVVGISASHGRGIDDLEETLIGMLGLDDLSAEEVPLDEEGLGAEEAFDSDSEVSDDDFFTDDDFSSREEADFSGNYTAADGVSDAFEDAENGGKEREKKPESSSLRIKIAVLGKPNTGKSTLVNLLTGEDLSIVSPVAGTTRDVIKGSFSYKNIDFEVLDTAGIRRKSKVEEDIEYYSVNRAIKTIDEADVILLMVDAVEGLSEQDKKIAGLIVRRGKGVLIVLNKIDLLKGIGNEQNAIEDRVRFLFPILNFAPIQFISAKKMKNIDKMLDTVILVNSELKKRVETGALNSALSRWGEQYQPPRGSVGHFKVYYGTQISTQPVRFLFFINRKKDFPDIYVQYLKNCIRRDLGFSHIPVEVDLRERERSVSNHKLGQNAKVPSKDLSDELSGGKQAAKSAHQVKTGGRAEGKKGSVTVAGKPKRTGGKAKAKAAPKKMGAHAKAKAIERFKENKRAKKS